MTKQIPLSQPTFGAEEVEAVARALESGWVAGQGPRGTRLEEAFAALTGVGEVVAVSNCTAALHLSLLALGVGEEDEVIVADYTFPATGHSVLYTGATPVFCDVRADTWTIDPAKVSELMTDRTRGIIAVDAFGQCADYDELTALAEANGLFVVEDAAAAVGSTYRNRAAGSLASIACFSLHARKGITSGEGGIVTTDDPRLAAHVRKLSAFGIESAFTRQSSSELPVPVFDELGYNYKLSDIQAAVALVQLDRLPQLIAARRRIAAWYEEHLGGSDAYQLPAVADDRGPTWQSYVLTLHPDLDRGAVAMALRERGVQANIGTYASHRQPVYRAAEPCPVSGSLFDRHLAIPMHPNLSDDDLGAVATALEEVVGSARSLTSTGV